MIDVEILEEELRAVAAKDPEVQAAVADTAAAAVADTAQFPQLEKLAEKISSVNFGTITTQNIIENQTSIGTQNVYKG